MADSETVVAQTSDVMGYTSAGYNSMGHADASSNIAPDTGALHSEATPEFSTTPGGSSIGDGNAYSADLNSHMQESQSYTTYETKPAVGVTDASGNVASNENEVSESSQVASYDSSMNGVIASGVGTVSSVDNGDASDNAKPPDPQQFGDASAMSVEEDRLWNIVKANSLDFNAWTALIEETERVAEDNILKIRKVYDAFLAEFPLCYGYWKKYADHEARLGSIDKVVEVYERAVQGVTYSVDIWLHYCIFAINTYGDPDTVRRLFERGLAYVGTDYLSFTLWDKYIEYEYMQQEWGRLAMIYSRILENPNQQLDRYWNSFKELAGSRPLSELRTAEEAAAAAGAHSEGSDKVNGEEVQSDGAEQSPKPVSAGLTEAEELEKYITIREEVYKKAKEFDSKIISFETAIRRPYFHVRPLNSVELENWTSYLDFIEREGDLNKVVKLYERCLIACANYPEYWIRYVLCMEAGGSMDIANNALARATQVFVKRQPEIHLFAARFKEQSGDIPGAQAAYQLVHSELSPGLLEAIVKHANMEHRLGNVEAAYSLYEQAIAIEKGKEHSQTLPMLYAQYSRFTYLVSLNAEKAREILDGALEQIQLSRAFLESMIVFETIQPLPKRIDHIDSLVVKFIEPSSESPSFASVTDREELSGIYLEFVNLFGDAQSIKRAEDRHAKLFLPHRSSTSELKKRQAEDFLSSDKVKLAKAYSGVPSPVQSIMGAYPNTQNQWPAGYSVQPQAWPPATQATQGQQWPAGYTQQPYNAYSGYGAGYTNPQAPAVAPQTAAYGAYPSTYPPQQAVPPQSYIQTENEESCTTYNMLKVSRHLFRWTKETAYADYYERALTNGVLSIQRGTEPGVMIYMLPLGRGNSKARSYHGWGKPFETFWCCYGTGIESFSKLGDSIYFEEEKEAPALYIIQYISSFLDWKSGQIALNQTVDHVNSWDPYLRVALTFSSAEGTGKSSTLNLRIPIWTDSNGAKAALNGQSLSVPAPAGSFLTVTRKWSPGDILTLQLPISLRTEAIKDDRPEYASVQAILYGPYLLAAHTSGNWDINTGSVRSLSDWITPIPFSYNNFLVSLSQESGSSSFVIANLNESIGLDKFPETGTDAANHATFRLVISDMSTELSSANDVIGKSIMLELFDLPGKVVVQQGIDENLGIADMSTSRDTSVFRLVQGLDGKNTTVSLESESNQGCYVYSENVEANADLKLVCSSESSSAGFNQAASFVMNNGINQYHPISFVAKGTPRNFLLAPLSTFKDESYTAYLNILT